MPLVLTLRPGEDFYVGHEQVTVTRITGWSQFEVKVTSSGRVYQVSDREMTELREIEDVYLQSGTRPQAGLARVAIDAPLSISILRGDAARAPEKAEAAEDAGEAVVVEARRNRWA